MTNDKPSVWSRPTTLLAVTTWAIVLAALFENWASTLDSRSFALAAAAGSLVVPYGLGVVATLASALVALVSKKRVQILANLNFSVAVVLAFMSIGLFQKYFKLF